MAVGEEIKIMGIYSGKDIEIYFDRIRLESPIADLQISTGEQFELRRLTENFIEPTNLLEFTCLRSEAFFVAARETLDAGEEIQITVIINKTTTRMRTAGNMLYTLSAGNNNFARYSFKIIPSSVRVLAGRIQPNLFIFDDAYFGDAEKEMPYPVNAPVLHPAWAAMANNMREAKE